MSADPERLRDFAQRYTAAWCGRNPAAVAAFFAPGGTLSVNGSAALGRVAITAVADSFMNAFPDLQVFMDDLREVPGAVEYHWTLTGTHTSGNRVRISGLERWQLGEDGLIANSDGRFDEDEYQRQL